MLAVESTVRENEELTKMVHNRFNHQSLNQDFEIINHCKLNCPKKLFFIHFVFHDLHKF